MSSRTLFGLVILLAIAAAGPTVDAQHPPRIAKVGYLQATARANVTHLVDAFRQGLRELGYAEGKSVV